VEPEADSIVTEIEVAVDCEIDRVEPEADSIATENEVSVDCEIDRVEPEADSIVTEIEVTVDCEIGRGEKVGGLELATIEPNYARDKCSIEAGTGDACFEGQKHHSAATWIQDEVGCLESAGTSIKLSDRRGEDIIETDTGDVSCEQLLEYHPDATRVVDEICETDNWAAEQVNTLSAYSAESSGDTAGNVNGAITQRENINGDPAQISDTSVGLHDGPSRSPPAAASVLDEMLSRQYQGVSSIMENDTMPSHQEAESSATIKRLRAALQERIMVRRDVKMTTGEAQDIVTHIQTERQKRYAQQRRIQEMSETEMQEELRKIKVTHGYPGPSKLRPNPPSIMSYPEKVYQKFTDSLKRLKYEHCPDVTLDNLFLSGERIKYAMYKNSEFVIKVGSGSFGDVFLAVLDGAKLVVIKLFQTYCSCCPASRDHKLIAKELAITQQLQGTGCVPKCLGLVSVLDTDTHRSIGLVFEHGGTSLYGVLMHEDEMQAKRGAKRKLFEKALIPREDLKRICYHISDGLAKIHDQNIMHNDLKLDNLLLSRENGRYKVHMIDFGMATSTDDHPYRIRAIPVDEREYHHNRFPHYAPETYCGGQASFKSDVYSLGLVLRRMANAYGFKLWLRHLASRCRHADPAERPTAREVAEVVKWGFRLSGVD
jgi:hypothetical protein